MKIRTTLLTVAIFFIGVACATIYPIPAFNSRVYHPCTDSEAENPVGKLCYSRCVDRNFFTGKCKEWEVDVKDFSDAMTFAKFRAAGFKMAVGL